MSSVRSVILYRDVSNVLGLFRFVSTFLKRALGLRLQTEKDSKIFQYLTLKRFSCTRPCITFPVFGDGNIIKRLKSSSSKDSNIISSTTILENNLRFHEVPFLVKQTNDLVNVGVDIKDTEAESRNVQSVEECSKNSLLESDAIAKVVKVHIVNSTNLSEVFRYLKLVPTNNISPSLALDILEKVSSLILDENSTKMDSKAKTRPEFEDVVATHTLCMLISRSDNNGDVLVGLQAAASLSVPNSEKKKYLDIFVNECLHRMSEGKFSLMEICSVLEALYKSGTDYLHLCDSLWPEIVDRVGEIKEDNVNKIFNLLPFLKDSRNVVLRSVEKLVLDFMPMMKEDDVIGILKIIYITKLQSWKILSMSSIWLSVNIHQVTESGLRYFLMLAKVLNHTDDKMQRSVEKYMHMKGSCCNDSLLMASLADYLVKFQWRNVTCLECIANFFVKNHEILTTYIIVSFMEAFSLLNYEPKDANRVFEILETVLTQRFSQFEPENSIAIMLACVQMQHYPLQFVSKIFRPLFLDRMNYMIGNHETRLRNAQNNLKLLDTALTLECPSYSGPHLYLEFKLHHKSSSRDARLNSTSKRIIQQIQQLLGGCNKFGECILVPQLPPLNIYIVDYMVYADKNGNPIPFNSLEEIEKRVAILILLPEHLCQKEQHLTGLQAMRIRHLQLLGYQVVCLEYSVLRQFRKSKMDQWKYLKESLSQTLTTCDSYKTE